MNYGKTRIVVCDDNAALGKAAASEVAGKMRNLLAKRETIRMVFAAGESQTTFLEALAVEEGIPWDRVVCFNVDDFWDVNMPEKFTCGYQTTKQLYSEVNPKEVHLVRYNAPDAEAETIRFEKTMRDAGSIDILCQGIGTSGHLALNEPGDTDFNDSQWVRVVDLAEQSKRQLIEDPNFKELGYIPLKGITMTIPAMLTATHIYTMVPLGLKRPILTRLFALDKPTTELPASILLEAESVLFVDKDSCPE